MIFARLLVISTTFSMNYVLLTADIEVINTDDFVAMFKQFFTDIEAGKTGSTGDEDFFHSITPASLNNKMDLRNLF